MKRLLLPLIAALALPVAANALTYDERFEICARYHANQITHQDAALKLNLKETVKDKDKRVNAKLKLKDHVFTYCRFYQNNTTP